MLTSKPNPPSNRTHRTYRSQGPRLVTSAYHQSSLIELLNANRIALQEECGKLDEAKAKLQGSSDGETNVLLEMIDKRWSAAVEEIEGTLDFLALQRPKTLREIIVMMQAADYQLDLLLRGQLECEHDCARDKRGQKLERIVQAVTAALLNLDAQLPQDLGYLCPVETSEELLARADSLAAKSLTAIA